jgi:hypothetical protein
MINLLFCCKRRSKKIDKINKDIKLDLNLNKLKTKDVSSIEINQSQSFSMMSHNLNSSTKDNIFQKQNKFNIVNHISENKLELSRNINNEKYNKVVYNIINVDNINNINNNNNENIITKELDNNNKDKIIEVKEENNELSEREKKLFEKESELSNKEKEINNILELIKRNRKLNEDGKKQIQKNNIINDVIKYKKAVSDYEENNNQNNINNIKLTEKKENKDI